MALAIALAASGCGSEPPEPERPKQSVYSIRGTVAATSGQPSAAGMVALLYGGGGASQFRVARQRMEDASNVWPYEPFQQMIRAMETQQPVSGCVCDSKGAFAFPKSVPRGTYVITVGIPTRMDTGVQLSREWPAALQKQHSFRFHRSEYELAAKSAWFFEIKIDDQDRDVTLGADDFVVWPVPAPARPELDALQRKLHEIDRLGKQAATVGAQRDQAQQKARDSGQPLHVKAFVELESKASESTAAVDRAQSEFDGSLRRALGLAESQ